MGSPDNNCKQRECKKKTASARGRGGLPAVRTIFRLEQEFECELDLPIGGGGSGDSAEAS